jgi:hypothetical protein
MGGGLLQLVAYGAQDAYLSGNPQITFWKGLYKRHTNFAMESFRVNFNGQPLWGSRQSAIVNRYADLLYSTYIEIELPSKENLSGITALWNHGGQTADETFFQPITLGYNLIDRVELDIGGQIIDRLYSEFMVLWSELTKDLTKSANLGLLLSNEKYTKSTLSFSANQGCVSGNGRESLPNVLYIPLMFFYTKNPGVALPLIALQYHEVKINVIWRDSVFVAGNFDNVGTLPQPTTACLYIDYVYLDTDERRRFAQQSHEYLIEQVQFNEDVGIASASRRIDLTFNHPVKELLWVVQPSCYSDCKAHSKYTRPANRLTPFVYDQAAVYSQHLQINGQDRMEARYGDYFNKVQPYQHHTGLFYNKPGAYCYSFAIKPEEHQPSGTCNFSRIDTATIVLNMDGAVDVDRTTGDTWDMRVYAINYNILRVMSGMGGLAFSN